MGKDDWYLCEGLLKVFIDSNAAKHQVLYKRNNSTNRLTCSSGAENRNQKVLLDLGSCKQTISIYNDNETGFTKISR